jgi:hypothetical protein
VKCYINQTQSNGVTGSGTLLWLRFKAVGAGTTLIEFSDSKLSSSGAVSAPITHNRLAGSVTVESIATNHDIAVEFDPPSNLLKSSQIMLSGTVQNLGYVAESGVNVLLYVDDSLIDTTEIAELAADSQCGFELEWIGATEGSHNVTVYALHVAGESNSSNNVVKKTIYVGTAVLHDLAISFEPPLPRSASLGDLVYIDAIVQNNGTSSEENLEAAILVNSQQVNRSLIRLAVGESYGLSYQLDITSRLSYDVAAFVTTVTGEVDIDNNRKEARIQVVDSSERLTILVVSDDDGKNSVGYKRGTSLPEFESILESVDYEYDVWRESVQGHPSSDFLEQYDLVIWTCGDSVHSSMNAPDQTDCAMLEEYFRQGGDIIIEGQRVTFHRYYGFDSLATHVLHTNYIDSHQTASLKVTSPTHQVARGLPSNVYWALEPLGGADGVYEMDGAERVVSYNDAAQEGAVLTYNGAAEGDGSVVLFTFPLYWIQMDYSTTLVNNSIEWVTRFGMDIAGGRMLNSAPDSVYFVYTDPDTIDAAATFDAAAGAMVYSLCQNSQYQGFTNTQDWFLPLGSVNEAKINNSIIVVFGNADNSLVTRYYEDSCLSPVTTSANSTCFLLQSNSEETIAAIDKTEVCSGSEDLITIQSFRAGSNIMIIMHGFSWRGTWATGIYFAQKMAKSLNDYDKPFYIISWCDENQDRVPQLREMQEALFS